MTKQTASSNGAPMLGIVSADVTRMRRSCSLKLDIMPCETILVEGLSGPRFVGAKGAIAEPLPYGGLRRLVWPAAET